MAGQEQVMLQLSSLLQKLNAGVDQAGPLLVKQILVERVEAGVGLFIGLALVLPVYLLLRTGFYKQREGGRYDDDGFGWFLGGGLLAIPTIILLAVNACTLIQLFINPMYYVVGQLLHP